MEVDTATGFETFTFSEGPATIAYEKYMPPGDYRVSFYLTAIPDTVLQDNTMILDLTTVIPN